jgi:hypothetical protein
LPGEVYLSIGVFEDPDVFRPDGHSWNSQRLGWFGVADDLPRYEKSSRPR